MAFARAAKLVAEAPVNETADHLRDCEMTQIGLSVVNMTRGLDRSEEFDKLVRENLRIMRLKRGLTLGGLSELTGFSIPLIQQHESGRSRMFAGQVKVYADALRVELDTFFGQPDPAAKHVIGADLRLDPKIAAGLKRDRNI